MFVPSMTYSDVYQAIARDLTNNDAARIEKWGRWEKDCRRKAHNAKHYPFLVKHKWIHPISKNIYWLVSCAAKRSQWDKPWYLIVTEFESNLGKVFIKIGNSGTDPENGRVIPELEIYEPHYISRFYERYPGDRQYSLDDWIVFLFRNDMHKPLTDDLLSLASENEKKRIDPEYIQESRISIDGISLCKRDRENSAIVLFKTFISYNLLYDNQSPSAIIGHLQVCRALAKYSNPQCEEKIEELYYNAIGDYMTAKFAETPVLVTYLAKGCLRAMNELKQYIILPEYPRG